MITKIFVQYYRFTTRSDLLLTYLLASIPLPVYNFVCFTSILFFYAFDYTSLDLGLIVSLTSLLLFCLYVANTDA